MDLENSGQFDKANERQIRLCDGDIVADHAKYSLWKHRGQGVV